MSPQAPALTREATPIAIAVVGLAFLFNFIGRGVADAFAAFILPLESEYGWSRQSMTGVFATYMLTSGLASPLAGWLFDRLGPRVVYGAGLALIGSGAWLSSRIDSLWQLYLCAGVMIGAGVASLGMVCASALIGRWFRRRLATAIAIAYAGFGSGILIMLPLVQWLIETLGWRAAYQVVGLAALALLGPCLLLPWRRLSGQARQHAGHSRAANAGEWSLASAMRSSDYWRLVQVFFSTAVAIYAVAPQTVAFLIESGFSSLTAASAYGLAGLLSTAGVIGCGWLCDRIGFGRTAITSFTLTFTGVASLLAIWWSPSGLALAAYIACFGIAQGARGPIVSTMTNRIFAGASAGTIYGTIYCSMAIGAAIGAWLGGVLHDAFDSYLPVFLLSLAAVLAAAEPFRPASALAATARRLSHPDTRHGEP
jgi:MFS family permease